MDTKQLTTTERIERSSPKTYHHLQAKVTHNAFQCGKVTFVGLEFADGSEIEGVCFARSSAFPGVNALREGDTISVRGSRNRNTGYDRYDLLISKLHKVVKHYEQAH